MTSKNNFFIFNDIDGISIKALVLMAADVEYGDALKSLGIRPYFIGIGPINAAVSTTKLLSQFKQCGEFPDIIINLGSGGSDQLSQGTIVQANAVSYRDMDATGFGFEKGQTPFSDLPAVLKINALIPELHDVAISTGAKVISNGRSRSTYNEYNDFCEPVAEMEAYAIYSAALQYGIPMIKIIGISDGKEALEDKQENWTDLLPEIDVKLAKVILDIQHALQVGTISRRKFLSLSDVKF